MATVLDEVTSDDITREHVERRVADWRQRIADLYDFIERELPPGWTADRSHTVTMDAEMMRAYGVTPVQLPVLTLRRPDGARGDLKPRALWIIGANGRLDLYLPDRHLLFVDRAENFASPEWEVFPYQEEEHRKPLTGENLRASLAA